MPVANSVPEEDVVVVQQTLGRSGYDFKQVTHALPASGIPINSYSQRTSTHGSG